MLSSLPLFTKPLQQRLDLLAAAHDMLDRERALRPVHLRRGAADPGPLDHYTATPSERVWRNFPPARVWVYRRP